MTRTHGRRAAAMGAVLLLCISGLGVRLGFVQVVRAEAYAAQAREQRVRKIELPARRGTIYDRMRGELAVSVPARTIYANPKQVVDRTATADALAPLLGRDAASIAADLGKDSGFVYLSRRIGIVTAEKVSDLRLPGVGVVDEARRLYPAAELASGVVGFIGTDQKGLAGLEFGYDELLGGEPGFRILEQDPRGRRIPQGEFAEVPPVPGADIVLTLHPDLQASAERSLSAALERTGAEAGMIVALDPSSGEILAMASVPGYDPNSLEGIDGSLTRNRTVTDAFEPGSVSKVVTAAAALTEGIVGREESIYVPGAIRVADKTFVDERTPPGSYDLRWIISRSSNLGTIRVAQMVGAQRLQDYMLRLGYGRGTGLGFPGESAGNLPRTDRWATALPTMAIGQSLSVTLLQLAQLYGMIANDGVSVEPRLVSSWIGPKGDEHVPDGPRRRRVLPDDVANTLRDMLTTVVSEGTGRLAAVPGFEVAGKTGTARKAVEGVGYRGHVASFVGMLPASDPRVVIAVVLDDPVPIEGGLAAAPVFSEVAKEAVHMLRIRPGS